MDRNRFLVTCGVAFSSPSLFPARSLLPLGGGGAATEQGTTKVAGPRRTGAPAVVWSGHRGTTSTAGAAALILFLIAATAKKISLEDLCAE